MIRVLVVDDQALVRTGFRLILNAEDDISVVGEADDGVTALPMIRELRPDVVIMDIRMPGMDGLEATRAINKGPQALPADTRPKVLMLTTFDLDEYVYEALRAGASGFLLKDAPPDDLINAVRVVAAGDALLAPSITKRLIAEFADRPSGIRPPPVELTDREVDVLQHLAKGMSNAEIAEALFVSETTVKSHVSHILTKLDLRDRLQAVVFAYESGLVTPG
jgi:DNA-binding NarL/FixJ family response regulator